MNEIFIRSDKGEYYPGDCVCGAIYLEIKAPTEACGVQLSFKGAESVCWECHASGVRSIQQTSHDYVDYNQIDLYRQSLPFALGSYCFPFKLQLPQLIPGTFQASGGEAGQVWSAAVAYQLYGNVLGAEDMVAKQVVVVRSVSPSLLRDNHITQAQFMEFPSASRFFGRKIHVTVKPLEKLAKTGECVHLRMVITDKKPEQSCVFCIKLVQILKVTLPVKIRAGQEGQEDHVLDKTGALTTPKEELTVASHQHRVIREMSGVLSPQTSVSLASGGGFDNILIPLKMKDGKKVIPSVHGKYVQCDYGLEVHMHFGDNREQVVMCDIASVLPADNMEWTEWQPRWWMANAEVKLGNTPISPSEHLLGGETFSSLPRFQEL